MARCVRRRDDDARVSVARVLRQASHDVPPAIPGSATSRTVTSGGLSAKISMAASPVVTLAQPQFGLVLVGAVTLRKHTAPGGSELVKRCGEPEITRRNLANVVAPQLHRDLAPTDVEVGVMVLCLG